MKLNRYFVEQLGEPMLGIIKVHTSMRSDQSSDKQKVPKMNSRLTLLRSMGN